MINLTSLLHINGEMMGAHQGSMNEVSKVLGGDECVEKFLSNAKALHNLEIINFFTSSYKFCLVVLDDRSKCVSNSLCLY